MIQILKLANPVRTLRALIFSYRTRNDVFLTGSKYCYHCHKNVDYDRAFSCGLKNPKSCPMDAIPM